MGIPWLSVPTPQFRSFRQNFLASPKMRVKKPISKRVNSRQRNRIQKKVSEHHRKARKLAKSNPQWKSRKPKELGVPNAFPFKEQVLAEREEVRRRREEERDNKRRGIVEGKTVEAKTVEKENDVGKVATGDGFVMGLQVDSDDDMEELSDEEDYEDEDEEDEEDEENEDEDEDEDDEMAEATSDSEWEGFNSDAEVSDVETLTEANTARNSKQPLYIKAINRSDLLIFVLDARAPNLSRSLETEQFAEKKDKECMFVLNRAELIPPETMQAWIDHLSLTYPTYPLLTSTSRFAHNITPSQSLATLQSAILKKPVTACFLGIPAIGKSTILNTLLETKTRPRPTTSLKTYALTSQVSVIDTPGLEPTLHPLLALFGLGRTNQATIGHLLPVLAALPEEYYAQLESTYSMPALIRPVEGNRFVDATRDLLVHVARKFGRMGKSGPNLESAAEIVGSDVVSGKIRWWTEPPKTTKKTKKSK